MMHSPAIGVGYFFWLRLRWALAGALVYTVLLAILTHTFAQAEFLPAIQMIGAVPLVLATVFVLSTFTYGPTDFGASTSGFPRYMMVQPARAAALVGWPMLYGTLTVAVLWVLLLSAMVGPAALRGPAAPYGGFFVAALAWFQLAAWCSFPVPVLRGIFTISAISLLVLASVAMKDLGFSAVGIVAGYVVLTLVAYGIGVATLWRARHGEGQTWNIMAIFDRLARPTARYTSFASPRRAQLWYELRRNSLYLPGLLLLTFVPMLLPLLGGRGKPLYIAEHTVDVRILMLLVMIGLPMFLAGALSVALGKFDFWSNKVPTFTPFFATRAYSTTGFVVTKWIAAAINALVVWAIVLIFLTLFLLTSTATERSQICHVLAATPARAIVKIVLLLAMFIFVTWRNQVTGFFVPMFGRAWFTNAMSFAGWLQFTAMATAGYGLYLYPAARSGVLTAVPWVIWGIAALKLVIAACLIRILRQADVVSASSMKMVWLALSAGFVALCAILYGIGGFSPLLIPAAILLLPMNRAGLAPLTLRANRHR